MSEQNKTTFKLSVKDFETNESKLQGFLYEFEAAYAIGAVFVTVGDEVSSSLIEDIKSSSPSFELIC